MSKNKKHILIVLTTIFIIFTLNIINLYNTKAEETTKEKNLVNIYFFHSDTCSHCQEEIKLLKRLENKYSNIRIYMYEINEEENKELFTEVQKIYNLEINSVPFTIIADKYFIGYNTKTSPSEFSKAIIYYSNYGYEDKVGELTENNNLPTYEITTTITEKEFAKTYGTYEILSISTDDITIELTNILTNLLSELNIYNILIIITLIILFNKTKTYKQKWIILLIYTLIYITSSIVNLTNYLIINKIIIFILINYLAYSILLYGIFNKSHHLIYSISLLLGILSNYLKITYYNKYISILTNIIDINCLSTYAYIEQLLLSFIVIFFTTIILIYLINLTYTKIYTKIKNKYIKTK